MNLQTVFPLLVLITSAACAQDEGASFIEYPPDQLQQLTQKFLAAKPGARLKVPAAEVDRGVFAIAEGSHLGRSYLGTLGGRYFLICSLRIANLTDERFEFKPASMRLLIDGKEIAHQPWPTPRMSGIGTITVRGRQLTEIATPDVVPLEPGEVKEVLGTFLNVPVAGSVQKLRLVVAGLPQPVTLDLMAQAIRELGLTTRRTGPRQCLGVMTIERRLDSISSHHLTSEMERLLAAGSTRILVRWGDSFVKPPRSIGSWLSNASSKMNSGLPMRTANGLPTIPQGIVEFHVSAYPTGTYNGDAASFIKALRTAYHRLPLGELAKDVETGDPQTRAAAIRGGVGRLPARLAPVLIQLVDSEDKLLSHAAIAALAAFPSEEAVRRVAAAALSEDKRLVEEAVTGLRDSRFPIAQRVLSELLATMEPKARDRVAAVLIDTSDPRPAWRDLYYEYASADSGPLVARALQVLSRVGHPDLRELRKRSLEHSSAAVRKEAFKTLAESSDPQDTRVAMAYTLAHIEKKKPTKEMLLLLRRLGSPEATGALIRHYEETPPDDQMAGVLLQAIAESGDESIVPFLLAQYSRTDPELAPSRKSAILDSLRIFHPPELGTLALEAIESDHVPLIRTACKILQDDVGLDVTHKVGDMLVARSSVGKGDVGAVDLIKTLGAIGTPQARRYLRLMQNGKSSRRREDASRALGTLSRRSSAAAALQREASVFVADGKLEEAEKKFAEALELDPTLPQTYVSRGHMKTHNGRRAEGVVDFDRALEIDPLHPIATSLKGISMVVLGDVDGGLRMIEDNRETFKWDQVFNYNAACAYGQAIKNTKPTAENLEKISRWKTSGIEYLALCVDKLHFGKGIPEQQKQDQDLITSDPDLDPFREVESFKELLKRVVPSEDGEKKNKNRKDDA